MDERYYSVDELAALLRLAPATVRAWRAQNRGPRATKVGRRVIFSAADVEAWLQAQQPERKPVPA